MVYHYSLMLFDKICESGAFGGSNAPLFVNLMLFDTIGESGVFGGSDASSYVSLMGVECY